MYDQIMQALGGGQPRPPGPQNITPAAYNPNMGQRLAMHGRDKWKGPLGQMMAAGLGQATGMGPGFMPGGAMGGAMGMPGLGGLLSLFKRPGQAPPRPGTGTNFGGGVY